MSRKRNSSRKTDRPGVQLAREQWQNVGFLAGLCERHWPNFALYSESLGQAEAAAIYRRVLDKVWESLAGQLTSLKNLENALEDLQQVIPDSEGVEHYGVYPAIDACLLLTSAVQMILDTDIDDSTTAAQLSLATVSQFIDMLQEQDPDSADVEAHELYQQELALQAWLQQTLAEPGARAETVRRLRRELGSMGASNLGISVG